MKRCNFKMKCQNFEMARNIYKNEHSSVVKKICRGVQWQTENVQYANFLRSKQDFKGWCGWGVGGGSLSDINLGLYKVALNAGRTKRDNRSLSICRPEGLGLRRGMSRRPLKYFSQSKVLRCNMDIIYFATMLKQIDCLGCKVHSYSIFMYCSLGFQKFLSFALF